MRNKKIIIFIGLILAMFPLVLGASTFFDNQDDFFIMADISVPSPVIPPTGGGGGGPSFVPECVNDSGCDLGEFCFENKCYVYECDSDADCNDTKTCWMNRCVKLFDMKILEVESPILPGEFFEFTYYLKGVAAIHGDVIVKFWLVQNDSVVTEGFDTIYIGDFDEKTETSELFLPKTIEPGVYNFYTELEYDSYYARAGRVIEVEEIVAEVPEAGLLTGQVIGNIGGAVIDNIYFILAVFGILLLFIIIYWERREIGKVIDFEKKWINKHKVSIGMFLFFIVGAGVLFYANKAEMIELSEFHMSLVEALYLVGLIFVGIVILARVRIGNLFRHFWSFLKSFFVKERELRISTEKMKLKPRKEIPKIALVEPKVKSIKLTKVKGGIAHKRVKAIHKKVKKILKRKKRSSLGSIVEKWKREGYDTESLSEKSKKLGQGKMRAWLEKWKKKGYDTGSINERGYEKMNRKNG